ncbi:meprin A subunit beta isoform X3 [Cryptotermes secundus]|nr:meprin A subunit beta isoform X3 [Cryptotermes secundus]
MKAMDHYHQHSCIRFKEWTGEQNYVNIFFNPDSGACWSAVGRTKNGEQRLSLGQHCWYLGIVIHELGHVIGFWHEMNRPDRDSWIYVYWNNIISGFESAFATHDSSTVNTLAENFDYRSIMMYDEYAFSKDGVSPTLQAKKPGVVIGPIWKKPGLSSSDIRRIHKLYKCEDNSPKVGFPYNEVCNFNVDTCGFKNGGSAVWNWRTVNSSDGYVYTSFEKAGITPGYFMSVNFHGMSERDRRGPMGCVRFWYMLQGDCKLHLRLSQAYLSSPTQLFYDPETMYELWEDSNVTGQWTHVEVTIYVTRAFKLSFQSGFSQTCTYGNIALDDIELYYTPCETASTTQYHPHATSVSNATKMSEETTSLCVTVTSVPTTTKLPSPFPISQTLTSSDALKPHLQNSTIFPVDFMKPSYTKN